MTNLTPPPAIRSPRAIVIEGRDAILDTGEIRSLPTDTPEQHPAWLLLGATRILAGRTEGTVIIQRDLRLDCEGAIREAGFEFTEIRDAWTSFRKPGCPEIHLGIRDRIDVSMTPLFHPEEPAAVIAARLGKYHQLTGTAWRARAGVAAHGALRNLYNEGGKWKQPRWRADRPSSPVRAPIRAAGPLVWRRPAEEYRDGWKYVHQLDARAAYAAAMGVAELAWTTLERTGPRMFDPAQVGYWLVNTCEIPAPDRWPLPMVEFKAGANDGLIWLTTPIMALLAQYGFHPEPVDSFLCLWKPRRILRPWSETLRDALARVERDGDQVTRAAVKATWAESVSFLSRTGGRIYRPDWADTVIDVCRANMIRKVFAIGNYTNADHARQIIAADTDALYYLTDTPDPLEGLPGMPRKGDAPKVGQLVYKGCVTLDEWEAPDA